MRTVFIRSILLCLIALTLAGCGSTGTGPNTWLDRPLAGDALAPGPVTLQAHASDTDGVKSVEFYIGSDLLAAVSTEGRRFVDAQAGWNPAGPGTYVVRARAVDGNGNLGDEAIALVTVGTASEATATPAVETTAAPALFPTRAPVLATETATSLPAALPSLTRPPDTRAPAPTQVATRTWTPWPPTATPVPPTASQTAEPTMTSAPACPGPPVIEYFTANPSTITIGGSTTLSWGAVTNATRVEFEPEVGGVPAPGSRVVSPSTTATYALVAYGCGGTVRRQVTVTVTRPAAAPTATLSQVTSVLDRWPPAISNLSANPTRISVATGKCANKQPQTTTVTARVTDASGVKSVQARYFLNGVQSQKGMSLTGGDQYQTTLGAFSVSGSLAIYVVATDTRNNTGQAGPVYVTVDACIQ